MRTAVLAPLLCAAVLAVVVLLAWRRRAEAYKASVEECAKRKTKKFYDDTRGEGGKCMRERDSRNRKNCAGEIKKGKCVVTKAAEPKKCKQGFSWNPYKQKCIRPASVSEDTKTTRSIKTTRNTETTRNTTTDKSSDKTSSGKDTKGRNEPKNTRDQEKNKEKTGKDDRKDTSKKDKEELPLPKESSKDKRCRTDMFKTGNDKPECFALLYKCDSSTDDKAKWARMANVPEGNWSKVCVARKGMPGCNFKRLGDARVWESKRSGQGCPSDSGLYEKRHYYKGKLQQDKVGNVGNAM